MTTLQVRFRDYSNEYGTTGVHVADAITNTNAQALIDAIEGVSIGTMAEGAVLKRTVVDAGSTAVPTNHFAQRELKFLCKYSDNVNGKEYSFTIPCADAALTVGNTDMVSMETGDGAALKTAFDANALSELGNAVTLNSIELIGRKG